jgi:hypothetical protein
VRTSAEPRLGAGPRGARVPVVAWDAAEVTSWRRAAEATAIVGAIALAVVVAGPGGGLEHLFVPLFGSIADPMERLTELAFGIPLAILLVPGLGLWAWGPRLRPAGTALTVLATLAVTVDLAVAGRLTVLAWLLLAALWLLAIYQLATFRMFDAPGRRPPALLLAGAASALPWFAQAVRLVLAQTRAGDVLQADYILVLVLSLAIGVLLALPLVRLVSFAPAGVAAAVGAAIYALMSLLSVGPGIALPQALAVLAVAASIAYVDTVRHMTSPSRGRGHGHREADTGASSDQSG